MSTLDDVVNESIIVCAIGKYSSYFPGSAAYFIAYTVSFAKAITRIILEVEPSSGYSYITICSASMSSKVVLEVSMILFQDTNFQDTNLSHNLLVASKGLPMCSAELLLDGIQIDLHA